MDRHERELVERLQRRDRRAWTELFDAYRDKIFRLCFRMLRSRQEAEDVTQEVFLRAVRSIGTFRGEASLKTWLYQIAHNAWLEQLSSTNRETRIRCDGVNGAEYVASGDLGADDVVSGQQLRCIIDRAIVELDPVFRSTIILREIEGLSYEEIAQATDASIETVKTRIHRARARLQQKLVEHR